MKHEKKYDIIIIGGLGHVGLPLGIAFANKGLKVCLYDIDKKKAERVLAGEMPFIEYGAEPVLKKVIGKELTISLNLKDLANANYIIVAIGTPVDEYLSPKLRGFFNLFEKFMQYLDSSQTIIIRSTVYPRVCEQMEKFLLKKGLSINIAYCPERIIQGYSIKELNELPQIVAGLNSESEKKAVELFSVLSPKVIPVKMGEAELIKLFANAWRYISFAVSNQFYMIATMHGENYDSIRKALMDGYGRAASIPGAGFTAGPCLLKDTMQLASFTSNTFQLGHAAMMVNEGLPDFIVSQLRYSHDLSKATVGILGMAFKADIDDTRDSLSFRLKKTLSFHNANVICSDYMVNDPTFVTTEQLVADSDIIIIGVPHSAYKGLPFPSNKVIIDLWGVTKATDVIP
ncbi:MAG: nucleotide sugar dehydrogenase [Bacteroidia bacterium]|nr:nucleotide sugar dehydrogenase [Bacteroidia bacterium]